MKARIVLDAIAGAVAAGALAAADKIRGRNPADRAQRADAANAGRRAVTAVDRLTGNGRRGTRRRHG